MKQCIASHGNSEWLAPSGRCNCGDQKPKSDCGGGGGRNHHDRLNPSREVGMIDRSCQVLLKMTPRCYPVFPEFNSALTVRGLVSRGLIAYPPGGVGFKPHYVPILAHEETVGEKAGWKVFGTNSRNNPVRAFLDPITDVISGENSRFKHSG